MFSRYKSLNGICLLLVFSSIASATIDANEVAIRSPFNAFTAPARAPHAIRVGTAVEVQEAECQAVGSDSLIPRLRGSTLQHIDLETGNLDAYLTPRLLIKIHLNPSQRIPTKWVITEEGSQYLRPKAERLFKRLSEKLDQIAPIGNPFYSGGDGGKSLNALLDAVRSFNKLDKLRDAWDYIDQYFETEFTGDHGDEAREKFFEIGEQYSYVDLLPKTHTLAELGGRVTAAVKRAGEMPGHLIDLCYNLCRATKCQMYNFAKYSGLVVPSAADFFMAHPKNSTDDAVRWIEENARETRGTTRNYPLIRFYQRGDSIRAFVYPSMYGSGPV